MAADSALVHRGGVRECRLTAGAGSALAADLRSRSAERRSSGAGHAAGVVGRGALPLPHDSGQSGILRETPFTDAYHNLSVLLKERRLNRETPDYCRAAGFVGQGVPSEDYLRGRAA